MPAQDSIYIEEDQTWCAIGLHALFIFGITLRDQQGIKIKNSIEFIEELRWQWTNG